MGQNKCLARCWHLLHSEADNSTYLQVWLGATGAAQSAARFAGKQEGPANKAALVGPAVWQSRGRSKERWAELTEQAESGQAERFAEAQSHSGVSKDCWGSSGPSRAFRNGSHPVTEKNRNGIMEPWYA